MARIARVVIPGIPHHITQRGNRRVQTFFCDDDYQEYMAMMSASCRRYEVDVWAYCLMPNHVHFIAVPKHSDSFRHAIGEAIAVTHGTSIFEKNGRGIFGRNALRRIR